MSKIIIGFFVILVICSTSFAQKKSRLPTAKAGSFKEFKLKDVPDSHWAAKSVYDLIRLGVTQGYPDGTFRGMKNITRFEAAYFLAKLAENLHGIEMEKISSELKSEFADIKLALKEKENALSARGTFEANYYVGNIFSGVNSDTQAKSPKGPIFNYRLRTTFLSVLDEGAALKINFDSMNGGYYGGGANLLTDLLDIEGTFRTDTPIPLEIKAAAGSGPKRHLYNNPVIPSENGRTYIRPYSGFSILSELPRFLIGFSYAAHNIKDAASGIPGSVDISRLSPQIGWIFPKIFILGRTQLKISADYFKSESLGKSNAKPGMFISFKPANNIELSTAIKAGELNGALGKKNLAVREEISFKDIFGSGSSMDLNAIVAGGEYILMENGVDILDEWALLGFDPFDRPYMNGSKALEFKIKQFVSDDIIFVLNSVAYLSPNYKFGKGYPNSRLTTEGKIIYNISQKIDLHSSLRVENDPNAAVPTNDALIFGLNYSF